MTETSQIKKKKSTVSAYSSELELDLSQTDFPDKREKNTLNWVPLYLVWRIYL